MPAQPSASRVTPDEAANETADRRKPAVLLVEDNSVNLKVLRLHLSFLDCRFLIARNGRDGVALFRDHEVDLILMDIMMPLMDGFEAARQIRRLERDQGARQTPIIAITAHVDPRDQHLCISAGMNDYLSKPVNGADLRRAIAIWAPGLRKAVSFGETPAND